MTSTKNTTILLTKEKEGNETLSEFLPSDAQLLFFPTLDIGSVNASDTLRNLFETKKIDYLVFQSANAVIHFVKQFSEDDYKKYLHSITIAAVGEKTKERCNHFGLHVALVPETFSATGLLRHFSSLEVRGKKFLLPRSEQGRNELIEGLEKLGAEVIAISVYQTLQTPKEKLLQEINEINQGKIDWFVFTSPSAYYNFVKILELTNASDFFANKKIAAIGKTTAAAIQADNVAVTFVPLIYTLDEVVKYIGAVALEAS